jgi:hypothetical protein
MRSTRESFAAIFREKLAAELTLFRVANFHEDYSRNSDHHGSSDRMFGLTIAAALLIVGVWRRHPAVFGTVAAGLTLVALAAPRWLKPLNRLWTGMGILLGRVTQPVVTAVLFFAVITPAGLLLRRTGKLAFSPPDAACDSYWIPRESAPSSPRRQF